ncbi:hypothetical protein halTADL_2107 [Halohasta litchfieldiae]|jgi:hypothetical protein|uniref:IclR helix-turn-helix domain-containing protein n=1 Tax=Halohasta litchfieldiae TaxID=1073996 RepID=A0A1H6TQX9_9EURY|nr:hypothetical protein [Halohasta litchfieldiae]ATW88854.1 hypothetical protein halTADL_2107 [Halohasta litchfieldiae]SEI79627.1 hypothetical protein SAMN05444271_10868 [Halohasta litchfieldiae]
MRSVALSVVFIVLLSLGTSPIVATGMVGPSESLSTSSDTSAAEGVPAIETGGATTQLSGEQSTPSTTFTINLQADRSANWVVTVEYQLTNETEREAFREIATEFEDGTATGSPDISLYENIAGISSEQTGRDMEIRSVERSSSLRGDVGTLELSFQWTEFLYEDGERLVFNDTLSTPDGNSWLTSLSENQELRITTPRGYAITSANVGFSDNTVVIAGPHTFDYEDHIQIILEPSFGPSWGLLGAAVVIGMGIIGGALLLRRREVDESPGMDANGGVDTASNEQPATEPEPGEPEPTEDLSLLADDERVLRLLERNGGRMRQADIVSETKWSDAKVSQLLSSMSDDGQITKLRIGRENLISLPGVDALDGSTVEDDDTERR